MYVFEQVTLRTKHRVFSILHFKTLQRTFFWISRDVHKNVLGCVYFIIDAVFVKNYSFHGPYSNCLSQAIEFRECGDIDVGGQDNNVMKFVQQARLQKFIKRYRYVNWKCLVAFDTQHLYLLLPSCLSYISELLENPKPKVAPSRLHEILRQEFRPLNE